MAVKGVVVPLITPYRDGEVDLESVKRHVDLLARAGIRAVFPVSTTGEGILLSGSEKVSLVETVIESARNVEVWPGTADPVLERTVGLARTYQDMGAERVVVVTPYYYPLADSTIEGYYRGLLERVDVKVVAYVIPSHTCNLPSPQVFKRLSAEYSHLTAVKVTTDNAAVLESYLRALRGTGVEVLPGDFRLLPLASTYGVESAVLGIANIAPKTAARALKGLAEGSSAGLSAYRRLVMISHELSSPLPCGVKEALRRAKVILSSECRSPLRPEGETGDLPVDVAIEELMGGGE
ncbi:MAG: dihydrodipicolinate synthase family protein [Desulfurococcales archaeon]|nr:dihydrodipicolinate synthase family protein [Desulfurococcales archaeon]